DRYRGRVRRPRKGHHRAVARARQSTARHWLLAARAAVERGRFAIAAADHYRRRHVHATGRVLRPPGGHGSIGGADCGRAETDRSVLAARWTGGRGPAAAARP